MKHAPVLALALTTALAPLLTAGCAAPPPKGGKLIGTPIDPAKAPPPMLGHNLLYNASLDQGTRTLPWTASFSAPGDGHAAVENGELCIEVTNKGVNRWDAHLRQQHLLMQKGHTYHVQFKMHASQKMRSYLKIGQAGPPYHEFWKLLFDLDEKPQVFSGVFTMDKDDDPSVEIAFHVAGQLARTATVPYKVCVDDARIDDPQYAEHPEPQPAPIPNVLVNQVGYFPHRPKIATVKHAGAVPWELRNAANQVVASGTTIPFGKDAASGDDVSIADFSSYTVEGKSYVLKVGADLSHPFDIRSDLYGRLKYNALAFFYQQRSGIPIEMPYAEDKQWVRPAGHLEVAPNHGDTKVPCAPGSGCTYTLDVSGGWYDAGDHGKYVVNAGISVWTLLDWWERTNALGTSASDFADGKMNIPENKNGVPDLLDEARWELEFELKMQVPEGQKLAGMVHHKVHDVRWTQLSMGPHEDPMERYLQPPSTAATLNLAANAAQAARVWKKIDPAFADKCLSAGERAWAAAKANPDVYAPQGGEGGGPYDDKNVTDDFYWAAAELYATTKKPEYKTFVTTSEHYKLVTADWNDNPGMKTSMTWGDTRALGSISLALVPNDLPKADIAEIKKNVIAAADTYLDLIQKGGYRLPFGVPKNGYPWGSTSFVLTNALMMGLAHDFSHDDKYLDGVVEGMDYILGRNGLDQSYVTGWGKRPLENPYHRFWCHQANAKYPSPPPGVLSGGPNSELQDPYVQAAGLKGCAPQKCFMDHGEAWSVNEVTINWNAPLVWVAAFLDEKEAFKAGAVQAKGSAKEGGLTPAAAKAGEAPKKKGKAK
jgi:endoglucanase